MFEDVPGSFCGASSSSSESMGLCFFALGKSRGFFTSAEFFLFAFVDFLFLVLSLWHRPRLGMGPLWAHFRVAMGHLGGFGSPISKNEFSNMGPFSWFPFLGSKNA